MIIDAVNHIDVSKYKESMSPLIKKDIDELFGQFSPYNVSEIDIFDGVDNDEVEKADRERSEIFAQLFAYALGGNPSVCDDKDSILYAYENTFKVVKSFISKYLGINFCAVKR